MTATVLERRIRWSGLLIVVGLLLQILTLPLTHPLASSSLLCWVVRWLPPVGCFFSTHSSRTPRRNFVRAKIISMYQATDATSPLTK